MEYKFTYELNLQINSKAEMQSDEEINSCSLEYCEWVLSFIFLMWFWILCIELIDGLLCLGLIGLAGLNDTSMKPHSQVRKKKSNFLDPIYFCSNPFNIYFIKNSIYIKSILLDLDLNLIYILYILRIEYLFSKLDF